MIKHTPNWNLSVAACIAMLGSLAATGATRDWPRWRGPNGDGIGTDARWDAKALASGPRVVWKTNVGKGWSSVSIRGRYLYTMGNDGDGHLFVAEASPEGYREIARRHALPSKGSTKCWTPPVLCKGRIFCRNSKGDLVSIHVGK